MKSLLVGSLAGADLTNAKLPDAIKEFEGLSHVTETSRNARKIFLGLILGCVYTWLTIATTTDVRLLTNSASSPLPIIQTEIPIVWFYWAAPAVLLCVYFYLHLYLQRLWQGLAALPAVFPDGKPLDERAYPWLLNGLVRAHVQRLKRGRPALSRFEACISIVLAWWLVPLTLMMFWLRYLPRHDWSGTILQIALIVAAARDNGCHMDSRLWVMIVLQLCVRLMSPRSLATGPAMRYDLNRTSRKISFSKMQELN